MPDVKQLVQEKYGEAARRVGTGGSACCGTSPASDGCCDPITSNLYDASQVSSIPEEATLASLGCGNPTALAALHAGETVLDLGSGGGIDVLLSARRVGPAGKAYGLDMTDEMLALARENQRKSGLANVEFLRGEIEHIPLPDNSVDVVISNCVINLSGRQGSSAARSVSCAEARRALCGLRCGHARRRARRSAEGHAVVGRLHRRCASGFGICRQADASRLRNGRDRADARLQRRGRPRLSQRSRRRRRRHGAPGRRQVHERVRSCRETRRVLRFWLLRVVDESRDAMSRRLRVLVLCTGNSARSQMAEAILRHVGKGALDVESAGTRPRPDIHPLARRAARTLLDLEMDGQHPKTLDRFRGRHFDYVITVCDHAAESCPYSPEQNASTGVARTPPRSRARTRRSSVPSTPLQPNCSRASAPGFRRRPFALACNHRLVPAADTKPARLQEVSDRARDRVLILLTRVVVS